MSFVAAAGDMVVGVFAAGAVSLSSPQAAATRPTARARARNLNLFLDTFVLPFCGCFPALRRASGNWMQENLGADSVCPDR
jgi:hypothetical protein